MCSRKGGQREQLFLKKAIDKRLEYAYNSAIPPIHSDGDVLRAE
jgi:hypothetical protein